MSAVYISPKDAQKNLNIVSYQISSIRSLTVIARIYCLWSECASGEYACVCVCVSVCPAYYVNPSGWGIVNNIAKSFCTIYPRAAIENKNDQHQVCLNRRIIFAC